MISRSGFLSAVDFGAFLQFRFTTFLGVCGFLWMILKLLLAFKNAMRGGHRASASGRPSSDKPDSVRPRGRPPVAVGSRLQEALGRKEMAGKTLVGPVAARDLRSSVRGHASRGGGYRPDETDPSRPPPFPVDDPEGPMGRVSELHFPEIQVSALPEMQTVSSRVTAFSGGKPAIVEPASVSFEPDVGVRVRSGAAMRARLASVEGRREAVLIGEILGRPRGLQY